MKWKTIGQGLLAVTASLGMGLGITSCSPSQTIDYVFVTSNAAGTTNGEVSSYHVDSESGALSLVAGSPFPDPGSNPVALVASPNQQYLYVANHDSSDITILHHRHRRPARPGQELSDARLRARLPGHEFHRHPALRPRLLRPRIQRHHPRPRRPGRLSRQR